MTKLTKAEWKADLDHRVTLDAAEYTDLMRREDGRDAIAQALAGLINIWDMVGAYETTASWSCEEVEATVALLKAVGANEGHIDAYRWYHAEVHGDGFYGDEYDAEILAEYPQHFIDRPDMPGIVTVDLPEQDVQA